MKELTDQESSLLSKAMEETITNCIHTLAECVDTEEETKDELKLFRNYMNLYKKLGFKDNIEEWENQVEEITETRRQWYDI